jgi:hypothetical protein
MRMEKFLELNRLNATTIFVLPKVLNPMHNLIERTFWGYIRIILRNQFVEQEGTHCIFGGKSNTLYSNCSSTFKI